jgi:hypothetical protein
VFYTETIYRARATTEYNLILCRYRTYANIGGGVLYCDAAAQRCYQETI